MVKKSGFEKWSAWLQGVREGRLGEPGMEVMSDEELYPIWRRLADRVPETFYEELAYFQETGDGRMGTNSDMTYDGMGDIQFFYMWEKLTKYKKSLSIELRHGSAKTASQVGRQLLREQKLAEQQKQQAIRKRKEDVARIEKLLRGERKSK
jgi:hypothetical protein